MRTGSPAFAGDDGLWLPQAHHVIAQRTNGESQRLCVKPGDDAELIAAPFTP
jgi:hypothetical protein